GTISNLNGSVSSLTPPQFGGTGGNVSAVDTSSTNFNYTFAPTVRGADSATVTGTFINGSADGQNLASSSTVTIVGTGVAPVNSVGTANTISRFNKYGGPN